MKRTTTHKVTRHPVADDGCAVVGVYVPNAGRFAWLHEDDYRTLLTRFGTSAWFANGARGHQYVRVNEPKTKRRVTIARAILDEPHRYGVSYRNGDSFDLRRSNLNLIRGGGGIRKSKTPAQHTLGPENESRSHHTTRSSPLH